MPPAESAAGVPAAAGKPEPGERRPYLRETGGGGAAHEDDERIGGA